MQEIKPYSLPKTNQKLLELLSREDLSNQRILDVGAGEGYFLKLLGEYLKNNYDVSPSKLLRGCDLYPENFKYQKVHCDKIDANGDLPYGDNKFDLVTSIEVIEHIEDQFHLLRELYRITNPGGRVFVTTPNILNVNSRIRFIYSGFGLMFDPIPLRSKDSVHKGHIHPVSFYYLAYIFNCCGFRKIRLHFDRKKKSAITWTILFYLPIFIAYYCFRSRLKQKDRSIYEENKLVLDRMNSLDMLTCRTVIVEGIK